MFGDTIETHKTCGDVWGTLETHLKSMLRYLRDTGETQSVKILWRQWRLEDTRQMYRSEVMFWRHIVCGDTWKTLEIGRH